MRVIMVMFDSLNRRMLEPYGCDWVKTPNFTRLAQHSVRFDNMYVGSMPCMPARREIHTGRLNFLHRCWGPVEPFDDSMPEMLKNNGIMSHLITDHHHYWEDGGATYHQRYSSFEFVRGQEGDHYKCHVKDPDFPETVSRYYNPSSKSSSMQMRHDCINRTYIKGEGDFPMAQSFSLGVEFLERNHQEDNWFLQLETFDPHEPFHAPKRLQELYPHQYSGKQFDWPPYARVTQQPDEVEHCRYMNAALVSFCDEQLGRVLDIMDKYQMWDDTMLIVNTDHGFMLGEHGWWAKCSWYYNEVAHTPLFIWDPGCGVKGQSRNALVQTMDLAPTVLDAFGIAPTESMMGMSLRPIVADGEQKGHDAVLFGMHGAHVNCTDGRYVYMRGWGEENTPIYNYTFMPTHVSQMFTVDELRDYKIGPEFSFTKGTRPMQIPQYKFYNSYLNDGSSQLFDLEKDPCQLSPLDDPALEKEMTEKLIRLMKENEAPSEQYQRLKLNV